MIMSFNSGTGFRSVNRGMAVMAFGVFSACGLVQDDSPGQVAERNIASDLEALYPGIDVGPSANCIRDNATEEELTVFSASNVNTTALTRAIFERPETLTCLEANNVIEVLEVEG